MDHISQFLFDPVSYEELLRVYSREEIAALYRPLRRYTEHCPAVLADAEWHRPRGRKHKGGKHHRNRYIGYTTNKVVNILLIMAKIGDLILQHKSGH